MSLIFSLILMMLCPNQGVAQSLGVIGEVFPVAEKSFIALIEERLSALNASGEWKVLNQRWVQQVAEHTNRPKALGLERIKKTRKHYYIPEVILAQDIVDAQGTLLYPKGTHVNALEKSSSYNPCWLFFNADDQAQQNWAQIQKRSCSNPKLILTGGAINEAEQRLNSVIYFDQEGRITQRLHISHVPAKVTRNNNRLLIVESAIKEDGHEL